MTAAVLVYAPEANVGPANGNELRVCRAVRPGKTLLLQTACRRPLRRLPPGLLKTRAVSYLSSVQITTVPASTDVKLSKEKPMKSSP